MSNQALIDAVRNWVHFDNLCSALGRQINTARNMRNTFEDKVLELLGSVKRLRIQGAILEPATRRSSVSLNWTTLEESLHKYFAEKRRPDETDAILTFLRDNRGTKSTTYLKKITLTEVPTNVIEDK